MFNEEVVQSLKNTDFKEHKATLARADRSPTQTALTFSDATDAANMNRARLEQAHKYKQSAIVKVRFNIIDPAKIKKK